MSIVETKFIVETDKRSYRMPVTMNMVNGRIEFLKSPFALKDDIKSMQGSKWHGYLEGDKRKIWSVADSYRNRFQIEWLEGGNPYEWFDRELIQHEYPQFGSKRFGFYDLMGQQKLMANTLLTYHYQVWGAEMGTGKTLAAIAAMILSGTKGWWWVGPKSSLYGIRQEFDRWGLPEGVVTDMMSYEAMMTKMRTWKSGDPAPIGVVFDEAHKLKTPTAQRTQCAQKVADAIRREYGKEGFCVLMTGTPSPKSPGDWWAPCEIAWPGFIREGSREAFEKRLGFYRLEDTMGGAWNNRVAWKDDENRCAICGHYEETIRNDDGVVIQQGGHHMMDNGIILEEDTFFDVHTYEPSINEVAELYERLKGLVTIIHKKDCLDLPDKVYKEIICEPTPSLLRVASALTKTAKNVITGLTQLRELSDGFQYRDVEDGYEPCSACEDGTEVQYFHPDDPDKTLYDITGLTGDFLEALESRVAPCEACKGSQQVTKYKRITREVPCPKEDAVVELLEQNEDQGRIVFFAGFTGSLERLCRIAQREGWDTMRVDGKGWRIEQLTGGKNKDTSPETKLIRLDNPMDYWVENPDRKIAFIAHPKSGGVSLTLCEQEGRPGANVACFYSNDFDPASRSQAEDRIHRQGMAGGATIVDLFHLPTDRQVLNVLRQNRKLELMTMGDFEFEENNVSNTN